MSTPRSELFERVKKGNDLMTERWLKASQGSGADIFKFWEFHDKWYPLLHTLCQQLMTEYHDCLYEGRKCKKDCWVCPLKC